MGTNTKKPFSLMRYGSPSQIAFVLLALSVPTLVVLLDASTISGLN